MTRAPPDRDLASRIGTALSRLKLRSCATVGADPMVLGQVRVHGGGRVVIGDRVVIDGLQAPVELRAHPGAEIRLGDDVRLGPGSSVEALGLITIDDRVEVGAFCKLLDSHFHPLRGNRHRFPRPLPVHVECGAVIGARAILLPGTRVAAGTRVPMAAVISRRGRAPAQGDPPHPDRQPGQGWVEAAARHAVQAIRGRITLGRAAAGKHVFVGGRLLVSNEGSLEIGDRVQFLDGILPSEVICRRGATLRIGGETIFNYGATVCAAQAVAIGRRCMIASFVRISDQAPDGVRPVTIGDEVWLAHAAVVGAGVTVGARSVVGAGSVVTRDIPPDHLALGNPARAVPLEMVNRFDEG